jgi:hypothetical protein
MGGEMLYILEQRLQAQAIVEEKSLRGQCLPLDLQPHVAPCDRTVS